MKPPSEYHRRCFELIVALVSDPLDDALLNDVPQSEVIQLSVAIEHALESRQRSLNGGRWTIPAGTPPAACKGCGRTVFWLVTSRGSYMPVDEDGTSHFATCPDRDKFKKKVPKK